jgi:hypothetical protein
VLPLTALVPTLLSYRFSSAGAGRGQQLPWLVVVAAAGAVLTVALSILTATLVLQHKTSEGEFEGAATGLGLAVVTPLLALLGAVCALAGAVIGRRHRAPPSGRAT